MIEPDTPDHRGYWREALLVEELTDEEIQAIATAEIPPECWYRLPDIED